MKWASVGAGEDTIAADKSSTSGQLVGNVAAECE